jgi:hypothetical protein
MLAFAFSGARFLKHQNVDKSREKYPNQILVWIRPMFQTMEFTVRDQKKCAKQHLVWDDVMPWMIWCMLLVNPNVLSYALELIRINSWAHLFGWTYSLMQCIIEQWDWQGYVTKKWFRPLLRRRQCYKFFIRFSSLEREEGTTVAVVISYILYFE